MMEEEEQGTLNEKERLLFEYHLTQRNFLSSSMLLLKIIGRIVEQLPDAPKREEWQTVTRKGTNYFDALKVWKIGETGSQGSY